MYVKNTFSPSSQKCHSIFESWSPKPSPLRFLNLQNVKNGFTFSSLKTLLTPYIFFYTSNIVTTRLLWFKFGSLCIVWCAISIGLLYNTRLIKYLLYVRNRVIYTTVQNMLLNGLDRNQPPLTRFDVNGIKGAFD